MIFLVDFSLNTFSWSHRKSLNVDDDFEFEYLRENSIKFKSVREPEEPEPEDAVY